MDEPHSKKVTRYPKKQRNWTEPLFEVKRVVSVGTVAMNEVGVEGNFRTVIHAAMHLIAEDLIGGIPTDLHGNQGTYQFPGGEENTVTQITVETIGTR